VKLLELFTDLVFLVDICWYFLGILLTDTKRKLGWDIMVSRIWQEPPFPSQKGALDPFWSTQPPFEGKRVSWGFFQNKCPQKLQKRIPAESYSTKNTNRIYTGQTASIGMVNNTRNNINKII
jgi:hypothetical protein